jgi:alkaline phosphatase
MIIKTRTACQCNTQQGIFHIVDVYLVNDSLRVAHDKNELTNAPTLNVLYLKPIVDLFKLHHGRISNDSNYVPLLVIDIKEKGKEVLSKLIKELSKDRSVFDRSINPKAVQVVISGDRGPLPDWVTYPPLSYSMADRWKL